MTARNFVQFSLCWSGAVGVRTAPQAGRSWVRFPMGSMEFFINIPSGRSVALGSTQPQKQKCVGLTVLPPLCADCLQIWEPQTPGTLRTCPGIALHLLQPVLIHRSLPLTSTNTLLQTPVTCTCTVTFTCEIYEAWSSMHHSLTRVKQFWHWLLLQPLQYYPINYVYISVILSAFLIFGWHFMCTALRSVVPVHLWSSFTESP